MVQGDRVEFREADKWDISLSGKTFVMRRAMPASGRVKFACRTMWHEEAVIKSGRGETVVPG